MTAKALATLVALIVLAGLHGAWSYAHDFYLYRGFPPPRDPAGVTAGRLLTVRFHSEALGGEHDYDLYLPPGYARAAAAGQRFPVVYLLHGAPGWPTRFVDAGNLGVALDTLVAHHRVRPFLVVMPDGRNGTFSADTEWANTPSGRYESYVIDTVHAVDTRWATLPDRLDRAIGGNSAGGYGATNIALHHLGLFGFFQSWSGYFTQTPTGPFKDASIASLRANSPMAYVGALRAQIRREPVSALIYGGLQDRDTLQQPGFVARLRGGRRPRRRDDAARAPRLAAVAVHAADDAAVAGCEVRRAVRGEVAFSTVDPLDILVVDDESELREQLRRLFARDGHRVTAVADGRSAIDRASTDRYDIVLLDVALGGGPGRLRRLPHAARPAQRGADHHAHRPRQRGRRRPRPRGRRGRLRDQAVRPGGAAQPHPRRAAARRARAPSATRCCASGPLVLDRAAAPGDRRRPPGGADVLGVRAAAGDDGAARAAVRPRRAAARDLGRQRLPRPARDRRPRAAPAREARGAARSSRS